MVLNLKAQRVSTIVSQSNAISGIFQRVFSMVAVATLGLASTGCDEIFSGFGDESALVHVFTSHHGTPEGGGFPDLGNLGSRTYETDLGWTVVIADAHLTTSAVSLRNCSGETQPLEFHYGQFPEDLNEPDLETKSLGSLDAAASTYCVLAVTYSPYNNIEGKQDTEQQ